MNAITIGLIISGMSEETTQDMPDGRSFEERVFARFDALDARLQKLEAEAERRAIETKPIWERALAEILAVSQKLDTVERKLNVLGQVMLTIRADQIRLEDRMESLDSNPTR